MIALRLGQKMTVNHPVLIFDGDCVLCSANARFVLQHDKRGLFRLAAMQGEAGAALMRDAGVGAANPDTIILLDGARVRRESDAVIAIFERLGWPWRMAGAARLIPAPIRDAAYRWIARNRYRLFGRKDQCFVPRKEWEDRVL